MLAGQLSNQDEDEVEDELEALKQDVERPVTFPNAPVSMPTPPDAQDEQERAETRRTEEHAPVPLLS